MPSTSARPSDTKSIGFVYCRPGASSASPFGLAAAASPSNAETLNPTMPSTHAVITAAPMISRIALMIWTYVVPFMPPTST